MAINQDIISTSWEGQQKSFIEAGLKSLLQQMLGLLEGPLAANSVGSNQLTQELRDVINSIGSKVPNTRTVNSKELSSNITIGPDDIMVGNQTLAGKLDDMDEAIGQGGDTNGLASRIGALESALEQLTGTNDSTQIIDTFNEVIDFLASVNNEETLVGKLQQLQTQINSKANDNAVVKGIKANGASETLPVDSNGIVTLPPAGSTISPATATPSMDGTANVGLSAKYAREDHVHPHDTSKQDKLTSNDTLATINGTALKYGASMTIEGPKGDKGDTGATGATGPQGPAGPKGDSGVSSADGVIVVDGFSGTPSDIAAGQVAVLSADAGKELNLDVNGLDFVGTWGNGLWPNTSGLSVGGTYSESTPDTSYASAASYRYCKKLLVGAGMNYRIVTKCNQYHRSIVITKTDGEIVYLGELNANNVDYTTSFEYDVIVYVNAHKDFTNKSVTCHIDGLEQRVEEVESETSQIGEIAEDVGVLENAINGKHVIGEWSARCWKTPISIAVGDIFSANLPNQEYGNDKQYDHCEKLQVQKGDTLVVKSKCNSYYHTLVITKTDGEVVVASGGAEINQSFEIEYNGFAYINKEKSYTGQKAEIHVYSPKEYTDEKFEAVSDFVDQQKLVGELFLSGYAFFNESKGTIFNPRGYALNGARIYIYQVVAGQKFSKIVASSFTGNYADYVFTDNAGRILKTSGADTYNTGIRTMNNVTAPEGATRLYVSENTAYGEGSSGVYASVIDNDAMVATRNLEATKMKISAEELVRYYHLGAQKMDTYNLVREKVGIITIGQSNIDGRIAAADFPATANINGTDISLAKSIPTCKYMRGTADSATYDEATRSFAAYNNTGAWSFDQVVYNAIANALGSETDFYVCKQSRGGTSIGYAQYTSFCADIDDFKFNNGRDWSQLYHLKCLVKRALELQPDLKFKAIIMHQGEQDENIVKTSGTYYINLCRLIQWIRGLVGSPKLPFIFGSIPTNSSSFNQIIYDDMVRVAADLNDVYLVTMGEATDWVDDQWHSGTTGLHFGANTAVKLADDMYQLMVSRKMLAPYV